MLDATLSKNRLLVVFSFFFLALFCLFLRLGFLQIFKSSQYLLLAQNQSRAVIEMPPVRGRILDREERDLALDVRLDSLYAVSREIKNKERLADSLSKILRQNRSEILDRLSRDKLFVWIARKIPGALADPIKKLREPGLGFIKESMRVYPKGETACHLIGFTGIDNDGLEGIELHYNSFLKGVSGWRLAQKDAKQRELVSKEIEMVAPVDGYDVHLTLDEVIQSMTEKELADTCRKFHARGGSITVLDPKTGDILAMANYPTYDLNRSKSSSAEVRRNRAITDMFEPGSVFKTFTLSAIVEEKVFGLDEKFNCENGSWAVAGRVLHDHKGYGILPFREVIEKSSNIGTVKGAIRLGATKLYKTMRAFGFGERTGIALAGEVNGRVPHPKSWSKSSIINIPIGQGVAVTPIQLVCAMGAIANNGLLMKPRIIRQIDDWEGHVVRSFDIESQGQAIRKETSLEVRSVLEGVVSRGTGKKAAVPGFKAAGKTGTAQKILPDGNYSHDQFIASFVGFVPYDEPRVVIAVNIDEPHPIYYGGEVAAPAFSHLASSVLAYWGVAQSLVPPEVIRAAAKSKKVKNAKEPLSQALSVPIGSKSQLGVSAQ